MIESAGVRRTVPLNDGELTIGSSPGNDVVLESEFVSRRHAVIRVANGGVEIEDLGSRNGTVINGSRQTLARVQAPCVIEFAPDARATLLTADSDEILLFPIGAPSRPDTSRSQAVPAAAVAPEEQATNPGPEDPLSAPSWPARAGSSLAKDLLSSLADSTPASPWHALLDQAARSLGLDRALVLRVPQAGSQPLAVLAARGPIADDAEPGDLDDLRRAVASENHADRGELAGASPERRRWYAGVAVPDGGWIALWCEGGAADLSRELAAVVDALRLASRLSGQDTAAAPRPPTARRAFRLLASDRVVVECRSTIIRDLHERMTGATTSDLNVLLVGDTGVGKEIYARSLHHQSGRSAKPFRAVNSGAIPESLLESLLFGAEDGVATGVKRQKGMLREADGGTFFLDEIGEMSPSMQAKLLRVIEERAVLPLGGCVPVPVNVRFVAATNRDLQGAIRAGRFREDLYQRLRGHQYRVPSLAEHPEDIPAYVDAFLRDEARKAGRHAPGITVKAMKCLMEHHWPGNVRELETTARRLVHELPDDGRPIGHADLPEEMSALAPERGAALEDRLDTYRRRIVLETLLACSWNRSEAARRLGVGRVRLRELMRRLNIEDPAETATADASARESGDDAV